MAAERRMMRVSVCMATYNGARYLPQQLDSILAQLGPTDELVVVDDASTDETVALLHARGDARIAVHSNERNLGLIATFERALRLAQGEIVFLADQDDVWLPGKVKAMADALQQADLVVSDCRVADQSLNELHPSFFRQRGSGPGLLRNLARNSYLGCCIALRRELLHVALPFPPQVPMHDWWLGLVGESFGRVRFLRQPLLLYRRHGGNASTTAERSTAGWTKRLRWRARLAAALIARRLHGRRRADA
jgi:glycosyltransferase involved in cell wall biosynthesis